VKVGTEYVDAVEVVETEYDKFIDATRNTTIDQPSFCSWNVDVVPENYVEDANFRSDVYPVIWVDWCDAYAYCQWAGKRLCGKPGGGVTPFASFKAPTSSTWMKACTGAAATAYPYGNTYEEHRCMDSFFQPGAVASSVGCNGGYTGLHDMSGNVAEWEDSCNGATGAGDGCRVRGGDHESYEASGAALRCDADRSERRDLRSGSIGFRCCSDTP
jgi:formylglycine-generating enzyme required for sulfatase activity